MDTRRIAAMLVLAAAAGNAMADKQSWDYKAYPKDRTTGQSSKERFVIATITLEESEGKARFRMLTPGRGDPCMSQSELPAEVARTPELLTLTVRPPLAGCEPFRYLIRTDGSGGVRQNLRGEHWVDDGLDHGLTPRR